MNGNTVTNYASWLGSVTYDAAVATSQRTLSAVSYTAGTTLKVASFVSFPKNEYVAMASAGVSYYAQAVARTYAPVLLTEACKNACAYAVGSQFVGEALATTVVAPAVVPTLTTVAVTASTFVAAALVISAGNALVSYYSK